MTTPYVDYTYYSTVFLGTAIASADFAALELRAENWINRATYQRAAPVMTTGTDTTTISAIKNAVCAVAEQIQNEGLTGSEDAVQSESQGQYSVTYGKTAFNSKSNEIKRMIAAREWLDKTALLFPGFNPGEYGEDYVNSITTP